MCFSRFWTKSFQPWSMWWNFPAWSPSSRKITMASFDALKAWSEFRRYGPMMTDGFFCENAWGTKVSIHTLHWLEPFEKYYSISQNGNLPQVGVNINNIWNHHLEQQVWSWKCIGILPAPKRNIYRVVSQAPIFRDKLAVGFKEGTPPKTNMTRQWNNNQWKMYLLFKMWIFKCHVSFQGCNFSERWFVPVIYGKHASQLKAFYITQWFGGNYDSEKKHGNKKLHSGIN